MKCALCGLEFNEKQAQRACSGCKSAAVCNLVKCPNCGYESPLESEFITKIVRKIKNWSQKNGNKSKKNEIIKNEENLLNTTNPLTALKSKQKGRVAFLQTKDDKQLHKLLAMGLTPGIVVTLLYKFPSYVLQVGNGNVALDEGLSSAVYVWLEE